MAQSWRGGIGKYPPIPERFGNTSRCPEAKPRDKGGIEKPRRMRWVFSNPTEPWLCHCHCNSEKNKYCQEVYIDQWKPLDNSKFFPIVKRFTLINVNLPAIVKFYYCQEVYIGQCKPLDNSKINFTIVSRFTLINVNLLGRYTLENLWAAGAL